MNRDDIELPPALGDVARHLLPTPASDVESWREPRANKQNPARCRRAARCFKEWLGMSWVRAASDALLCTLDSVECPARGSENTESRRVPFDCRTERHRSPQVRELPGLQRCDRVRDTVGDHNANLSIVCAVVLIEPDRPDDIGTRPTDAVEESNGARVRKVARVVTRVPHLHRINTLCNTLWKSIIREQWMRGDRECGRVPRLADELVGGARRDPSLQSNGQEVHSWKTIEAVLEPRHDAYTVVGERVAMLYVVIESTGVEILGVIGEPDKGNPTLERKLSQALERVSAVVRITAVNVDDTGLLSATHRP